MTNEMKTINHKDITLTVDANMTDDEVNKIKANITRKKKKIEQMEMSVNKPVKYAGVIDDPSIDEHVPESVKDLPVQVIRMLEKMLKPEHEAILKHRQTTIDDEYLELGMFIKSVNHQYQHLPSYKGWEADKAVTRCIDELHEEGKDNYDGRLSMLMLDGCRDLQPHKKMNQYQELIISDGYRINDAINSTLEDANNGYVRLGVYADSNGQWYSEWQHTETRETSQSPSFESKADAGAYPVGEADVTLRPITFKTKLEAIQLIKRGDVIGATRLLVVVKEKLTTKEKLEILNTEQGLELPEYTNTEKVDELYEKLCA